MDNKIPVKLFLTGCVLTILLAFSSSLGGLNWLNFRILDQALSLPIGTSHRPHTLIIHNDLSLDAELAPQLDALARHLRANGAHEVAILLRAPSLAGLVTNLEEPVLIVSPEGSRIPTGKHERTNTLPLSDVDGVIRGIELSAARGSLLNHYPAEALARHEDKRLSGYLNYFLRLSSIPNFKLSQANESAIPELVSGRVVLVDLETSISRASFSTPDRNHSPRASFAELQALAVENLLSGATFHFLPGLVSGLLLLLIFATNFFSLQLLAPRALAITATLSISGLLALALLLVYRFALVLPVAEILLLQLFSVLYYLMIERTREEQLITGISAKLNARLNRHLLPPSFYLSAEPWKNLHTLIDQQLELQRSILLEKVHADHRVKEIHALNCSMDDILERRRDYERQPYADAITSLKPTRIAHRQYFQNPLENEVEYLVPLVFAGDVLGFWALTIISEENADHQAFESHLAAFGSEIAELLFHRERFHQQSQRNKALHRRLLTLNLALMEYESMGRSVASLEKRLDVLEDVFNGMSTASVLYNLFGQIVLSNNVMETIVQGADIPIYSLTSHDFLLELTSLSSENIKRLLLEVTVNGNEVDVDIDHPELSDDYTLKMRPIKVADEEQEGTPFLMLGILFEFIDVSSVRASVRRHADFYQHCARQLQDTLQSISGTYGQLSGHGDSADDTELKHIQQLLSQSDELARLIEVRANDRELINQGPVPVKVQSQLAEVLADFTIDIKKKNLRLEYHEPATPIIAEVKVDAFIQVLKLTMGLLVEDSEAGMSSLEITLEGGEETPDDSPVLLGFRNKGYGLPSDKADHLKNMGLSLMQWGAGLTVNVQLGVGYDIRLKINAFRVGSDHHKDALVALPDA